LLQVHEIPADGANAAVLADAGIAAPSYYLLRPDGHVGLCGARVDVAVLERYATEQLRMNEGNAR
jgi:hypothetical protein